jgi:hypothetical protein
MDYVAQYGPAEQAAEKVRNARASRTKVRSAGQKIKGLDADRIGYRYQKTAIFRSL